MSQLGPSAFRGTMHLFGGGQCDRTATARYAADSATAVCSVTTSPPMLMFASTKNSEMNTVSGASTAHSAERPWAANTERGQPPAELPRSL